MSHTAEQELAARLYREFSQQELSADLLVEILGPLFKHLGFNIDDVELRLMVERMRKHAESRAYVSELVDKWRPAFAADGPPSPAEASSFIQDILSSPRREMLFSHRILAGTTVTQAGGIMDTITRHTPKTSGWTLHLTSLGKSQVFSKGQIAEIDSGQLVLFKPNADCHYQRHPDCRRWDHSWILFQPRPAWLEWLAWPQLDEDILQLDLSGATERKRIETLFDEIIGLGVQRSSIDQDLQVNLLEQIVLLSQKLIPQQASAAIDSRISHACDYIRGNLAEGFSVEDVASHCNLSPSHLSHLFKEQIGISPKRWRDDLRLVEARKLLADPQRSIASIAETVGYNDPLQFSRLFRKKIGCSPTEFRNLNA